MHLFRRCRGALRSSRRRRAALGRAVRYARAASLYQPILACAALVLWYASRAGRRAYMTVLSSVRVLAYLSCCLALPRHLEDSAENALMEACDLTRRSTFCLFLSSVILLLSASRIAAIANHFKPHRSVGYKPQHTRSGL